MYRITGPEGGLNKRIAGILLVCSVIVVGCDSQPDLKWQNAAGYRWADLPSGYFGSTGFSLLDPEKTGIQFRNDIRRELVEQNRHFLNGSGVAAGDVDGDGLVDIYFARLDGPNKLYKNLGGFRFEDITGKAGVALEGYHSTGAVLADVDGDSDLDLLVSSLSERNTLWVNDGRGHFTLKTDSGLGKSNGAMTMALADIDGDGLLDLYITNYKIHSARDRFGPKELALENTVDTVNGAMSVRAPFKDYFAIIETVERPYRNEIGEKDELYVNRGNSVFEQVDDATYFLDEDGNPKGLYRDWGLTSTFRDVTGDRRPDLYVANDFWTPDRFWINQGDGIFRAAGEHAVPNMSFSSMGVDFSDIDRDGLVDFVVTEMLSPRHQTRMRQYAQYLEEYEGSTQHNRNSVYLNRGDTTFAQIAYYSGLQASEWTWSTQFLDVDLDGYEDLILSTGFGYDYQDMDTQLAMDDMDRTTNGRGGDILDYPVLKLTNKIFRNNHDLTFTDQSREWGFAVEDLSHGMAMADLDNDGAMDLIINRQDETAAIYQNKTRAPRIAIRLKGNRPNTQGVGALIEVTGGPVVQSKEIVSGGNYLSGSQAQIVFAAEGKNQNHMITVTWPGGRQSRIEGVKANRIYEIDESAATATADSSIRRKETPEPLFEDVSNRIHHTHHEGRYDDYRFAPLLPLELSRLGPGVAWMDIDRNGYDDLLVTSGKSGTLALFNTSAGGRFEPGALNPLTETAAGDQTAVIGWMEDDLTRIVVGSANYEQGDPDVPSAFLYTIYRAGRIETHPFPGILSTTGPLAAADYTGDGRVDLFIGGRFKPGQYPRDAQSRLFRNVNGTFQPDENNARLLSEVGLVTGAVFTDFDRNGSQDLLISTEWGSLRLFENTGGTFREITAQVGLDVYKGWWNGVATGDFNNDGLPDIVATNIGRNSPYQINSGHPVKMFYGDFNWDRRTHIVEAYYDSERESYVPMRKLHDFGSIPRILRKVQTHAAFADGTVNEIFDIDANVRSRELNTLEHTLFVNTGKGFEPRVLPAEAQFTAAFCPVVADFDNDGNEDLFLSKNFFGFPKHVPRLDAGRGLYLRGDGKGNFVPVSGSESGIKVYGEQRGAASSDFDRDGRVDLAVTQNRGETRLFHNRTGRTGVRVQLVGPVQNHDAIGSSLRVIYADKTAGPRRTIQAGSGYWSQNSTTQVIGINREPVQLEVTWFDGKRTSVNLKPDVREYQIRYSE